MMEVAFTIPEWNGYEEGKMYERKLSGGTMFGNKAKYHVSLRDEERNKMSWRTSERSNTFQNFRQNATYRFKVDYITNADKTIHITRMTIVE